MNAPLTEKELATLEKVFHELSWIDADGWQSVASYAGWRAWLDDQGVTLARFLRRRQNRIALRRDCRSYYGKENVDNINDPSQATWA